MSESKGASGTEPVAKISWRGQTIFVYVSEGLDLNRDELIDGTAAASTQSNDVEQLRSRLDELAQKAGVKLMPIIDKPDHAAGPDRVSVGFVKAS